MPYVMFPFIYFIFERERNIDLLFYLVMHSLGASCMYPDPDWEIKPTTLAYGDGALTRWATLLPSSYFKENELAEWDKEVRSAGQKSLNASCFKDGLSYHVEIVLRVHSHWFASTGRKEIKIQASVTIEIVALISLANNGAKKVKTQRLLDKLSPSDKKK